MKSLSRYLKGYEKETVLAPLFKLLEVVFDLLVPIVVARMINLGVAYNDRGYILKCFFILLLMAAVGSQLKYAVIMVASIPVIMIYPFVQKYFIQGALLGSLKE